MGPVGQYSCCRLSVSSFAVCYQFTADQTTRILYCGMWHLGSVCKMYRRFDDSKLFRSVIIYLATLMTLHTSKLYHFLTPPRKPDISLRYQHCS